MGFPRRREPHFIWSVLAPPEDATPQANHICLHCRSSQRAMNTLPLSHCMR
jgi:hypothetical protein